MPTIWRQPCRMVICLLSIVVMFSGCSAFFQDLEEKMDRQRFSLAYESFENALAAYEQGDYAKALSLFQALVKADAGTTLAGKARLGEIFCRLMLATTQSEYEAVMAMWQDLRRSAPEQAASWEWALVDPLMVSLAPTTAPRVIVIHRSTGGNTLPIDATKDHPHESQPLQDELASLKKIADHAAHLQRQMDEIMAENHALKEKIKALETIDQNIQKRKTEIGAPRD